jgi:hypothetical protein
VIATLVVRRRRARRDEPEATPPSG